MQSAVQVVDLMYGAAGASAIYAGSRLGRLFRDIQVLRQHVLYSDSRYTTAGQVYLGLPPDFGHVAF
jgi:hypothetical protein